MSITPRCSVEGPFYSRCLQVVAVHLLPSHPKDADSAFSSDVDGRHVRHVGFYSGFG